MEVTGRFDIRPGRRVLLIVMNNETIWSTLDALIFRFLGLAIGLGGAIALLSNNRWDLLSGSPYGLSFLVLFSVMGLYCAYLVTDTIRSHFSKAK